MLAKHDFSSGVRPRIYIADETERGVRGSVVAHPRKSSDKVYYGFAYSLRARLNSGRYKVVAVLSPSHTYRNSASCGEYLKNGGKDFLFRLAASKHSAVSKIRETEKVERMLTEWEMGKKFGN